MKRAVAVIVVVTAGFLAFLFIGSASPPPPGVLLAAGQNQDGTTCTQDVRLRAPQQVSGRQISMQQVARYAYKAGWRGADVVIAVAVATGESTRQPGAVNRNGNGSTDYGLLQINSIHEAILASGDWRNPGDNAEMGHAVWEGASGSWTPWVAYNSGSYRKFMADAQRAVDGLGTLAADLGCRRDVVTGAAANDPGKGPQGSNGLTPRAQNVKSLTMQQWGCGKKAAPCISSIGGYAPRNIAGTGQRSDHATGNADDIMLGANYRSPAKQALGVQIAEYWVANAEKAGIKYVIFDRKIWNIERGDPVGQRWADWRSYSHPGGGGDTLAHVDHVHVSVLS